MIYKVNHQEDREKNLDVTKTTFGTKNTSKQLGNIMQSGNDYWTDNKGNKLETSGGFHTGEGEIKEIKGLSTFINGNEWQKLDAIIHEGQHVLDRKYLVPKDILSFNREKYYTNKDGNKKINSEVIQKEMSEYETQKNITLPKSWMNSIGRDYRYELKNIYKQRHINKSHNSLQNSIHQTQELKSHMKNDNIEVSKLIEYILEATKEKEGITLQEIINGIHKNGFLSGVFMPIRLRILERIAEYLNELKITKKYYNEYKDKPVELLAKVRGIQADWIEGEVSLSLSGVNLIFNIYSKSDYMKTYYQLEVVNYGLPEKNNEIVENNEILISDNNEESKIDDNMLTQLNSALYFAKLEILAYLKQGSSIYELKSKLLGKSSHYTKSDNGLGKYIGTQAFHTLYKKYHTRVENAIDFAYKFSEKGNKRKRHILSITPIMKWNSRLKKMHKSEIDAIEYISKNLGGGNDFASPEKFISIIKKSVSKGHHLDEIHLQEIIGEIFMHKAITKKSLKIEECYKFLETLKEIPSVPITDNTILTIGLKLVKYNWESFGLSNINPKDLQTWLSKREKLVGVRITQSMFDQLVNTQIEIRNPYDLNEFAKNIKHIEEMFDMNLSKSGIKQLIQSSYYIKENENTNELVDKIIYMNRKRQYQTAA